MSASIYAITPTTASVTAGGAFPLTTIARRQCGCVSLLGSDSIILERPGYYKVTGTVTFTAPEAGNVTVVLTKDGQAVPGITASTTVATADTEIASLAVSGIVRVFCSSGSSTIQLVNSGVAVDSTNVSLDVEYLG